MRLLVLLLAVIGLGHIQCFSHQNQKGDHHEDLVTDLPGLQFKPNFKFYSGYVSGTTDQKQLFYMFFESQGQPEADPLVLWLNGGPGCSSVMGALSENGPFRITTDKKVYYNNHTWNQNANILYLESPVGVGYSYDKKGEYGVDDNMTAQNNLAAIKNFLEKFPEYKSRDFYITGESYGGVYVPSLAALVVAEGKINLKAIAIGNGLSSYEKNDNSLIYFAYNHGLLSTRFWEKLTKFCCSSDSQTRCQFTKNKDLTCQYLVKQVNNRISNGLNVYNLYSPCVGGAAFTEQETPMMSDAVSLIRDVDISAENTDSLITPRKATVNAKKLDALGMSKLSHSDFGNLFRKNLYSKFDRNLLNKTHSVTPVRMVLPCEDDTLLPSYLNDVKVKSALHVRPQSLKWDVCSADINLNYNRTLTDMSKHYQYLLSKSIRILVYNGDVDMACNYLGDEWFLDDLNLKLKSVYRPWYYTDENGWKQVAGWVKTYKSEKTTVTFATVRGSGHMVPTDRPAPAYRMFSRFLEGQNL